MSQSAQLLETLPDDLPDTGAEPTDEPPHWRPRITQEAPRVDLEAAESAAEVMLRALGLPISGEDMRETPRRLVAAYAEMLTVPEFDLTTFANSAAYDELVLAPIGVGVVIEAEHSCMTLRGARAEGARTVTSTLRGNLREDPASRAEFLALTRGRASR